MKIAPRAPRATLKSESKSTTEARLKLASLATDATKQAIAAKAPDHPLLEKFGESLGMGLGVIVTEALAASKTWNAPVLNKKGQPVKSVEGAKRIGNHDIKKRHEEVVGPKITALVAKMKPGVVHDLLEGMGKGATAAPGTSYRMEAAVSDFIAPPLPARR
jgi:hypothetical protein